MPVPGALLGGRYRLVAPLGSGGMATVHKARDERLERDVAVKILLPNHAGDPVLARRFEREARSLAAAAHPGVVAVYDVDPGDPGAGVEPYFVMELCRGGSLADRLASGRRMSPDELVPILVSIADGLSGLHARGVIHRDVKPSNILLGPTRAKLADFGLARSDDPSELSDLTAPGTAVGTMPYLAPEVLAGGSAGPAADIYALAVAAFAGLTGMMPRAGSSIADLVAAADVAPPLVSAVAPDLGTAFDASVAAALDPNPARRPDAVTLGAELTSALGRWSRSRADRGAGVRPTVGVDATTVATPVPPTRPIAGAEDRASESRRRRDSRSRSALLAALAGVALAIAVFALAARAPTGDLLGSSAGSGESSPVPSASATPSPAPSPSPSPSPPPPTPTPAATPSVADRALAALDDVDAAIEAARGDGGLKGKEANELERRVREIRSAVTRGDLGEAEDRARSLANAVDKVSDEIDEDEARRLQNAADAVVDILRDR